MKTPSRIFGLNLLLVMAAMILLPVNCEAQVIQMTTEELTMESTSILYGECTDMESAWTEDHEMILTTITVVPERYLKGDLGNAVTITVPGGQVGDILYEVSEMPAFQKGEEVFTFLWKHPSGMYLVTGGEQGKLKIDRDSKTGKRSISGRGPGKEVPVRASQELIRANKKTVQPKPKSNKISLDDFTKEVEGYLNNH